MIRGALLTKPTIRHPINEDKTVAIINGSKGMPESLNMLEFTIII